MVGFKVTPIKNRQKAIPTIIANPVNMATASSSGS
jgi:hypothetical protein